MGFSPSLHSEKTCLFPYLFPIIISSKTTIGCFQRSKMSLSQGWKEKCYHLYIYIYNVPKSSAKDDHSKKDISSEWRLTSQSFPLIYQGTRWMKSCQISCSSVTWKKKQSTQWILIQRTLGPKVTEFGDVEGNLKKTRSLRDVLNVIQLIIWSSCLKSWGRVGPTPGEVQWMIDPLFVVSLLRSRGAFQCITLTVIFTSNTPALDIIIEWPLQGEVSAVVCCWPRYPGSWHDQLFNSILKMLSIHEVAFGKGTKFWNQQ